MAYPLADLGGTGQLFNILPANGFPVETYLPALTPLMPDYRIISVLPRALWGGEPIPDTFGSWERDVTGDLLAGLHHHNLGGIIGAGHSFGAVSTMIAAVREPSRFRALVLFDPTILPTQILLGLKALRDAGTIMEDFPMASRALKRQRQFATREDAYAYYYQRGIFRDWDMAAFDQYIAHGLVPNDDGLALRWTPEWEAYYFSTGYAETWEMLPKLDKLLPILIIRGGDSDVYTAESAAAVREILPQATHAEIAGHGHLFPQSAPADTARIVSDWLARLA